MVAAAKTKKPKASKNGKPKREAQPAADDAPAPEVSGEVDALPSTATVAPEPAPAQEPPAADDDPTTPEALARYDAETVVLVNAKADDVTLAEQEENSAAEDHKAAKKYREVKEEELRDLIRERREQRGKRPQKTLLDFVSDKPHDPASPTPATEADPHETLWQQFPVGGDKLDKWVEWGLTEKDVEKLNEGAVKGDDRRSPILVMGDVSRFITPNPNAPAYSRSLADLKGFGPAAVDRWAEAEVKFWGWWKNFGGRAAFAKEMGLEARPGTDAGGGSGGDGDGAGQPNPVAEQQDTATGTPVIDERADNF